MNPASLKFVLSTGLILFLHVASGIAGESGYSVLQGSTYQYTIDLPKGYAEESEVKWPAVLFLHGAGERGDEIKLARKHGPPKLIDHGMEPDFILITPQCPKEVGWDVAKLLQLIEEVSEDYSIDPDRFYVTGLSMGGYGTFGLLAAAPELFAAAVPICGGGKAELASRFAQVPVWAFHGLKDTSVPPEHSREMIEAMKEAGAREAKLTEYEDRGHDVWTETYERPDVWQWLLSKEREY